MSFTGSAAETRRLKRGLTLLREDITKAKTILQNVLVQYEEAVGFAYGFAIKFYVDGNVPFVPPGSSFYLEGVIMFVKLFTF